VNTRELQHYFSRESLAKLINILAASVGGGIVLGAAIRLGEAIAAQYPAAGPDTGQKLAERLGQLENRLLNLEASPAAIASRFDKQAAEVSAVRSKLTAESLRIEALGETSLRLRGELGGWLEESVATRMAEVEARLRTDSERGQRQVLDAFAESVQTRVVQRISRLEEEVAGQSAAMSELREFSLRTELSMQKLLGGLDRLIVKNPPSEEAAPPAPTDSGGLTIPSGMSAPPATAPEPPPAIEPPAFETRPRSSRWKIFG